MRPHPSSLRASIVPNESLPMKTWRKVHIFSFGYLKPMSLFVAVCMFFIAITGVLLNHKHDFRWMETTRVPTVVLPPAYQEKLDAVRQAQGTADLFLDEAHSAPILWVVTDLHTGEIFGSLGPWFYDLVGISFAVLSVSGIVMYFKIRRRKRY